MTTSTDAILVGGPNDDTLVRAEAVGLVEVQIDGLVHRYIRTTEQRQRDGAELTVYNYDGAVAPGGGESGVENASDRAASPLASGLATDLPLGEPSESSRATGS